MKSIIALSAAAVLLLGNVCARAETSAGASRPCYDLAVLLDSRLPFETREPQLQKLQAAAADGGAWELMVLGSLYRLGPEHPAALLPKDVDLASRLLGQAALRGRIWAMAGLAEMELERGEAMQAMIWAQALAHFNGKHYVDETRVRNRAYEASLIQRAYAALGRRRDEEIVRHLHGFIARYGETIDRAVEEDKKRSDQAFDPAAACPGAVDPERFPLRLAGNGRAGIALASSARSRQMERPGSVLFHLSVDAKGRPVGVLVVDALPDARVAKGLEATALRLRFNDVAADAPLRRGILPMVYDDFSVALRGK